MSSNPLVQQLVEAGVHFGHKTSRWNPKMRPYIYGRKNLIHIIDVRETVRGLLRARKYLSQVAAKGSLILFVGTGGSVMPKIVRSWFGEGAAPDMLLTNAVLLNIALLIFGWRRYADLQREVTERRKAEARANELAAIDPMTGILNRRSGGPAESIHELREHRAHPPWLCRIRIWISLVVASPWKSTYSSRTRIELSPISSTRPLFLPILSPSSTT